MPHRRVRLIEMAWNPRVPGAVLLRVLQAEIEFAAGQTQFEDLLRSALSR